MSNWLSLCYVQIWALCLLLQALFFSFIPQFVTLQGIPLPTSNKLSSLGDFNSYNLESFHFSLFPRQMLIQLNVIFHLEYLKPPKCFLLPFNLSMPSTATRGRFLQCKSDHVGSRKVMASIALWIVLWLTRSFMTVSANWSRFLFTPYFLALYLPALLKLIQFV